MPNMTRHIENDHPSLIGSIILSWELIAKPFIIFNCWKLTYPRPKDALVSDAIRLNKKSKTEQPRSGPGAPAPSPAMAANEQNKHRSYNVSEAFWVVAVFAIVAGEGAGAPGPLRGKKPLLSILFIRVLQLAPGFEFSA
jgi:hypothetical protein